MDENSTSQAIEERASHTAARIARLGIPKQELAAKAGIDRGTLGRALKADPAISDRTWVKIERVLGQLEEDMGVAAIGGAGVATTASGESVDLVTSTMEYAGARITLSGRADAVAEAIRQVLAGGD